MDRRRGRFHQQIPRALQCHRECHEHSSESVVNGFHQCLRHSFALGSSGAWFLQRHVLAIHSVTSGALYQLSGPAIPVPWITNAATGSNRVTLSWEGIGAASSYSVKRSTSETGTYQTIATGVTNVFYTDLAVQNAWTYYYVVSVIVGGRESPNSAAFAATPAGMPGIVSWNYDRYGTPVSYTHLRAHETRHDLVCRLLLEKKKKQ